MAVEIKDRMAEAFAALNRMTVRRVLVGIPSDKAPREPEPGEKSAPLNNAEIGYIMERGDEAGRIPPRPWLVPGVRTTEAQNAKTLEAGARKALNGNPEAIDAAFQIVGLRAVTGVRKYLQTGPFAPLSEATLRDRAARGRKGAQKELDSRDAGNAPNNANARPLIDSGQMRNAVTYVIRDRDDAGA